MHRFNNEVIIIPLQDSDDKICNIQQIYPDGNKFFLKNGKKKGCFHVIGNLKKFNTVFLVEGYATGASVYLSTKLPVIVCFDAYNLKPVLEVISNKYPDKNYFIAADNDVHKEVNIGKIKADEAALLCNAKVILPCFNRTSQNLTLTDWNDLHVHEGLEEVSRQLKKEVYNDEK